MKFNKLFAAIKLIVLLVSLVQGQLTARGNLRPIVTFASGLSPRQITIIRLMIKQKCHGQHGRFAERFC